MCKHQVRQSRTTHGRMQRTFTAVVQIHSFVHSDHRTSRFLSSKALLGVYFIIRNNHRRTEGKLAHKYWRADFPLSLPRVRFCYVIVASSGQKQLNRSIIYCYQLILSRNQVHVVSAFTKLELELSILDFDIVSGSTLMFAY